MGIETPWYKKDIVVDSRLYKDVFITPTLVCTILILIAFYSIYRAIEKKMHVNCCKKGKNWFKDELETEYLHKLEDLNEVNQYFKKV